VKIGTNLLVALAAAAAWLAIASSASATALCTTAPGAVDGACSGSKYPSGTNFSASLNGLTTLEFALGAGGSIECLFSSLKGKTTSEGGAGEPVTAEVTSWIFGSKSEETKNCVLVGLTACTISDALNVSYASPFNHTAGTKGNGTLTFRPHEGGGNPAMIVKCGIFVNCIFKAAEIQFSVVGGSGAIATVTNKAMETEGATCPPEAKLTAQYKLSPSPMHITA
jgi:hypothetical protein